MTIGPTDRLLRSTRRRLFALTLGLLVLLVAGIGAATAVTGLGTLDADVDRALAAAVEAEVQALGSELPAADEEHEPDEQGPAAADTFMLVLDPGGAVVANPSGVSLAGLPDTGALDGARTEPDLRTVKAGDTNVRLRTVALTEDGQLRGFVQGGFVLTLHDRQSQSLVMAVIVVGALGLVCAAIITLFVTGRALVPIRDAVEAQRRFVADASHELRTPAALIRANAEVLQREDLVADDGRPLVEDIVAESDRLGGLVGEMLQVAAWDGARTVLAPAAIDAADVAAETVRGATALATERGVRLNVEARAPVPAWADRDRLVQLLLILIDNAIDHSPSGGVVTVRVHGDGREAVIDVDDQGPGIPAAERARIFEPFTRLAGTTRHGSGGTGLGLAIGRRIADAHGGTIIAADGPAGGARFTVTLPAPARHGMSGGGPGG